MHTVHILPASVVLLLVLGSMLTSSTEAAPNVGMYSNFRAGNPQRLNVQPELRQYFTTQSRFLPYYGMGPLPSAQRQGALPTAARLTDEDLFMEIRERKSNNLRNLMRIGKRSAPLNPPEAEKALGMKSLVEPKNADIVDGMGVQPARW
ncbi:hypothetical protein DdX_08436 [Ditylenchus destructor]|uniref:Uncharacterized protein n=1 Tax=Ditylenchus destructor TaxID=166010 RepID=A0AAD4N7D0_9BILA|nr:hypothetical protein DdX_08436 [Ditylenchus destructor]